MLPLPGLSSASGKSVVVKFDGGLLSSDGGVLALREIETRLRVADRLAAKSRRRHRAAGRRRSPDPRAQIDDETPKSPAPMHNAG
jgi:hypothetical protein